jgi:hypothetical protein
MLIKIIIEVRFTKRNQKEYLGCQEQARKRCTQSEGVWRTRGRLVGKEKMEGHKNKNNNLFVIYFKYQVVRTSLAL